MSRKYGVLIHRIFILLKDEVAPTLHGSDHPMSKNMDLPLFDDTQYLHFRLVTE